MSRLLCAVFEEWGEVVLSKVSHCLQGIPYPSPVPSSSVTDLKPEACIPRRIRMRDQSEEPSESGTSGVNILTKDAGNSRRRHACLGDVSKR